MCFILANMGIGIIFGQDTFSILWFYGNIYYLYGISKEIWYLKCARIFSQIQLLAKDRCKGETNYNDNGIKFISDGFECQLC